MTQMTQPTNKWRLLFLPLAAALTLSACSSLPTWAGGKKEKAKLAGTRIPVVAASSELQADEAAKEVPFTLPEANVNESWPQQTGTFNAQTSNLALSGALDKSATASIGEGNSYSHTLVTRPVVGGGLVYAMDAVGHISAHDKGDIAKIKWRSKGVADEDEPEIFGGGLAFDDGRLYAVSGRGMVAAFDAASGKELWHKSLRIPLRSAPHVDGGKIFIITIDNQIYALNASDGEVQWNQRGISETAGILNSVSPVTAGGMVVAPFSSGEIYVLSASDGKETWSDSLSPSKHTQASAVLGGIGGDPVIDGEVVVSVSAGGSIAVKSLRTGQTAWTRPIGSLNTPWITGESLFVLTADNTLVSFVKFDGSIRWSTKLASFEDESDKSSAITWRGPVMVEGKLAVVSSKGQLLLINATDGKVAATKTVPEDIYTAPVVAGNTLYLVRQDATLYSLR